MTNLQEKSTPFSREEKNGITKELLHELFDYKDGLLYWKVRKARNTKIGNRAGRKNRFLNRNYLRLNKEDYINARIIFIYHHGYYPIQVDHINRNRLDDRIENLRAATASENMRNSSSQKNSSSQYIGVSWVKRDKNWLTQICINGKQTRIKQFKIEIDAALAYNREAVKHFGEFASINIIKNDSK